MKKNISLRLLIDMWIREDLNPGALSNGTVITYSAIAGKIKSNPISQKDVQSITVENLQEYVDSLRFSNGISKEYMRLYTVVLNRIFKFAVYPKKLIKFNPIQYINTKKRKNEYDLFDYNDEALGKSQPISQGQFNSIENLLVNDATLLPVKIAYYTGLRVGEVCGLSWDDIHLEEQYLIVRRSMRYNAEIHKTEIDTTKNKRIRIVDFCDSLAIILKEARLEQLKRKKLLKDSYKRNYYKEIYIDGRKHYELKSIKGDEIAPSGFKPINFVCLKKNGDILPASAIGYTCRKIRKKIEGLENFHFHCLRHTFTTNLIKLGAPPKDVQELLGHSDINITMNIYTHSNRDSKRNYIHLLDNMMELSE